MTCSREAPIGEPQRGAYQAALRALSELAIDFLVGGGFALHQYIGRWRSTKDLDLFLRVGDVEEALGALAAAGFHVERTDPTWLYKAWLPRDHAEGTLIDLIFSSYNRLFPVDDHWFGNGREARVLDVPVRLVGPEEMLVSKAFVAARDRFDGSDVAWLIRALGADLDWQRVLERMGGEWEVLLWQLIHYRYVFPRDADRVPPALVEELLDRARLSLRRPPPQGAPSSRGRHFDAIHYLAAEDGGPYPEATAGEPG